MTTTTPGTTPRVTPAVPQGVSSLGRVRSRLMVGGPTHLPPDVLAAGAVPVIDERTDEFADIFTDLTRGLQSILCTQDDVLVFTASTTGAQESVLQNLLSPGDRVLVASNGFYGERWTEMCRAFQLDVVPVTAGWGTPLDLDRVAATTGADKTIRVAFAVHSESSTGMVNDMAGFAAACGGVVSVVDAASSVGACELETGRWGIDVVVASPQKALMAPPGVSFVSISEHAWAAAARATMPRYYFDWEPTRRAYADHARTAFTPAVGLIRQFHHAVALLLAEGLPAARRRHQTLGRLARLGCTSMGLSVLASESAASPTVTAVRLPAGLSARHVVGKTAADTGVQLTYGSGHQADEVVRLGHCGDVDAFDVMTAVNALELTLHTMGVKLQIGAAAAAMQIALVDYAGGTR